MSVGYTVSLSKESNWFNNSGLERLQIADRFKIEGFARDYPRLEGTAKDNPGVERTFLGLPRG